MVIDEDDEGDINGYVEEQSETETGVGSQPLQKIKKEKEKGSNLRKYDSHFYFNVITA